MSSPMTQEQRYIKMTETPISRLIPSLAVPTIISMLVTSIYNMADTFFVSQISTSASAAVGVSYSLMSMIQALGFTLGMGSGNYLSRVLGSRDTEKAERIASTGFYSAIFVGLLFALICLPNLDRVVRLLGATDSIAPYAKDYARYILIAAPVMTGALSMNNLLRFQGLAVYSMIGFGQGFQPVCGFNFGAKRYDRVLESFWFCVKVSAVFLTTLAVVSFIGAPQIMRVFRKEDLDVIEIGTWAMRFQCLTLPLSAWIVMSNMLTQTIGYGFRASFVAAGRQGLFLIPALFVLPVRFGIRGLQWCQPVADALTFVLGAVIILGILKELKGKAAEADKEPRNVA